MITEKQKQQNREGASRWRKKHPEEAARIKREYHLKIKMIVHKFYGNHCNCCGETNPLFLTVDHVDNDGFKDILPNGHRRVSGTMYGEIIKRGFPSSYQLLCWNCNCGKRMNNGICPHALN